MKTINAFLTQKKVPFLMKAKVRNYVKYMYYNTKNDYEVFYSMVNLDKV